MYNKAYGDARKAARWEHIANHAHVICSPDVEGREDWTPFMRGEDAPDGSRQQVLAKLVQTTSLFKKQLARRVAQAPAVAELTGETIEAVVQHERRALVQQLTVALCGIKAVRVTEDGTFETITITELGMVVEMYLPLSPNRHVGDPAVSKHYYTVAAAYLWAHPPLPLRSPLRRQSHHLRSQWEEKSHWMDHPCERRYWMSHRMSHLTNPSSLRAEM